MLADVARLTFENPDLDEAVVRGIYQHQVLATGHQPTLRQAREYVGHLTSHLDDATIRVTLGLPPAATAAREPTEATGLRTRRPGRPGWTQELFWAHYCDARGRSGPVDTYAAIAAQFEMLDGELGTEPDYLRKLVKRFGLPPA